VTKLTLPAVNLDLTLERGKMKAISEAATSKSTEYVVRVDQLRTIPGFNVRVRETNDYRSDLDALKQSIRENGFYTNKPLAGYIGKDGDADVIYITDGHRRLEAVQEINAEALNDGEQIEGLPVVLKPADSSIGDLTIALAQDNSGRPLTPYEMGIVVQRLAGMKDGEGNAIYSKADIARKLSITERYIDDLNVLVAASPFAEEGRREDHGRDPEGQVTGQDQGHAQAHRRHGEDADRSAQRQHGDRHADGRRAQGDGDADSSDGPALVEG
jgi:ParB family chromosome partitioning protein